MKENNTLITFFRLLYKRGFVMAAFFWTLFINANSYENNINNISPSDIKLQGFIDIYFSKKILIQLEKVRRGYAKEKPLVEYKIQRNKTEINRTQKFFFIYRDDASVLDRKDFLPYIQKNIQNTDTVFFTDVINNNVNTIHFFAKKSVQRNIYNSFFSDKSFIRFLFSLPPPAIS